MPNVQIDEGLFFALVQYHLLDQDTPRIRALIQDGLERKVQKMADRQMYAEQHLSLKEKTRP